MASLGLVLYILILILLLLGHISEQSTNNGIPSQQHVQLCVIGLRLYGLIPLLVYDVFVTISLTAMFVIPIAQSDGQGHSARRKPSVLRLLRRKARRRTRPITLPTNRRADDLSPQPNYVELGDHSSEVRECAPTDDQSTVSDFELEDIQPASLRRLALRSLIACFVGLTTSVLNLSILVANDGREEGTTCIRWWLADVVINAVVICAVMQGRDGWWSDDDENMPPTETLPLGVWGSNDKSTHGASILGRQNDVSGEVRTAPRHKELALSGQLPPYQPVSYHHLSREWHHPTLNTEVPSLPRLVCWLPVDANLPVAFACVTDTLESKVLCTSFVEKLKKIDQVPTLKTCWL
ncbi:hypothetical protein FRB91_007143 [Serendipita sp. 411]|nr:hypothetical protein FRB91_007143 [Serendipita sp. 411]